MKRYLAILAVTLSLGGCASVSDIFHVATTQVTVTPKMVHDTEEGLKAVTVGLVGYRRLCIKKIIDPVTRNCRRIIEAIQPYTKAAASILPELRASVKANDQKNAIDAYKALQSLIQNVQSERLKAGV